MDRLLTTLNSLIDTAYVVFMTPGRWLASSLFDYFPSLAGLLGVSGDESAGIAPLVLTIVSWLIVASLVRRLRYSLQRLAKAIIVLITRIRFRTVIALRGYQTMLTGKLADRAGWQEPDDAEEADDFRVTRLDMMVLHMAKAGGPGYTLSALELAERLHLQAAQIQESLDKLSKHKLLDFALSTTDGFENYRLNKTGSYVLTMWQRQQAGA
jgi:DNA-binding MarR family transcriptional regulator